MKSAGPVAAIDGSMMIADTNMDSDNLSALPLLPCFCYFGRLVWLPDLLMPAAPVARHCPREWGSLHSCSTPLSLYPSYPKKFVLPFIPHLYQTSLSSLVWV